MQIILKHDYKNIGKAMDVVTVKDGYALNFLIPSGIAFPATEGNKRAIIESKRVDSKREEKKAKEARQLAKKIEEVPCTISVKVKQDEQIFGSVTSAEIADFLKKEGFNIDRSAVMLDEPIKQLGVYTVSIKLFRDIHAKLKVWVVKEEE